LLVAELGDELAGVGRMILDAGEFLAAVVPAVQALPYELLHAFVVGHTLYAAFPERGQGRSAFYEFRVVRPPGTRALDGLLRAGATLRLLFLGLDRLRGSGGPARNHIADPGDEIAKTPRQIGYSMGDGAQQLPDPPPRGIAHAGLMTAKPVSRALHIADVFEGPVWATCCVPIPPTSGMMSSFSPGESNYPANSCTAQECPDNSPGAGTKIKNFIFPGRYKQDLLPAPLRDRRFPDQAASRAGGAGREPPTSLPNGPKEVFTPLGHGGAARPAAGGSRAAIS
jgi:hypothetical protein